MMLHRQSTFLLTYPILFTKNVTLHFMHLFIFLSSILQKLTDLFTNSDVMTSTNYTSYIYYFEQSKFHLYCKQDASKLFKKRMPGQTTTVELSWSL